MQKNIWRQPAGTLKYSLLLGALGAALVVSSQSASAQVVVVAPPAPVYVAPPAPRVGYVWHRGFWVWRGGRYFWMRGYWSPAVAAVPVYPQAMREYAVPPRVERISADALFPFDRGDLADMLPAGRADIEQVAARISHGRFDHIEVRGYTDHLGSSGYNHDLSERRANAVKQLLIQQGIPADKIQASGLGEQDPIAQCDSQLSHAALVACLQPDRRVEIVTYAEAGAQMAPGPDGAQGSYAPPDDRSAPGPNGGNYDQSAPPPNYGAGSPSTGPGPSGDNGGYGDRDGNGYDEDNGGANERAVPEAPGQYGQYRQYAPNNPNNQDDGPDGAQDPNAPRQ
ncbi:MAG: OmpA family protein [Janthinobacterium lividum]